MCRSKSVSNLRLKIQFKIKDSHQIKHCVFMDYFRYESSIHYWRLRMFLRPLLHCPHIGQLLHRWWAFTAPSLSHIVVITAPSLSHIVVITAPSLSQISLIQDLTIAATSTLHCDLYYTISASMWPPLHHLSLNVAITEPSEPQCDLHCTIPT